MILKEENKCCACNLNFGKEPFDYQISAGMYSSLFTGRDPKQFSIIIKSRRFDFLQKNSKIDGFDYHVDCCLVENINDNNENENEENNENNENEENEKNLLRRLFLCKKISVNHTNYQFLHDSAEALGLLDLLEMTEKYFYVKKSAKSVCIHIFNSLFNFIGRLGLFNRLLVSFWDLAGPLMFICLFLNILILFVTMALMTLKDYMAAFVFVVIPFLLYTLYFPNLISISTCEALERNIFRKKTFFYAQQKLISKIIRITLNIDNFPKYFNLGKYHDFVHGILFLIFIFGFLGAFMGNSATLFLDVWLQIFVFYIPLIRYSLLYVLYFFHIIISLFEKCREKFKELRDFEDPFLTSIYFNEFPWKKFICAKNKKNWKLILKFIFSKSTFSLIVFIAIIIYMACAETKMNASQICITLFIFCLIFIPLATCITFPFFWIRRIRDVKMTDGKLEEIAEIVLMNINGNGSNMDTNNPYNTRNHSQTKLGRSGMKITNDDEEYYQSNDKSYDEEKKNKNNNEEENENENRSLSRSSSYNNYVVYSSDNDDGFTDLLNWKKLDFIWNKKYNHLRWSSVILCSLTLLIIVILIPISISVAIETSKASKSKSSDNSPSTNKLADYYNYYIKGSDFNQYSSNNNNNNNNYFNNNDDKNNDNNNNYLNEKYMFESADPNSIFRKSVSPACFMKPKGLSIKQIIAITLMAHVDSPNDSYYRRHKLFFFPDTSIEFIPTGFSNDKAFLSQMIHLRIPSLNLSVFSVRGTVNSQDIIADAEIWLGSVMINLVIPFIPFVELYSDRSIELIGVVTNLPRYAFKQFSLVEEYVTRFTSYINKYLETLPKSEDVLIVGHSLGGGLAKILSLETGIQAVAVSGPGVRMIMGLYKNNTVKNVKNSIVDLIPGEDLIARVDLPIGTQVNIPCRTGMSCHDAKRTVCQVAAMCGEMEEYINYCLMSFDQATIDKMVEQGNPPEI